VVYLKAGISCLQCSLSNFFRLAEQFNMRHEHIKEFLTFFASLNYNVTSVEIVKASYEKTSKLINNNDPYFPQKKMYNQKMLEQYSDFCQEINTSADPIRKAITLSIGGNIIDFLPKDNKNIDDKIKNISQRSLAVDDVNELLEDLRNASSILYLTDNAGEIVLDKLLIQTLVEHNIIDKNKITVATRGLPVLNDATLEDAEEIGLTAMVKVISNGDNAPGTLLKTSSKEFQKCFNQADVVIAKGSGNFESLDDFTNKNIYFLFVIKCNYLAEKLGLNINDFICKKA